MLLIRIRRIALIGSSSRCRPRTGGSQASAPYEMKTMLERMASVRRRRRSFVQKVVSTNPEAM
jgi:hypothetical protein